MGVLYQSRDWLGRNVSAMTSNVWSRMLNSAELKSDKFKNKYQHLYEICNNIFQCRTHIQIHVLMPCCKGSIIHSRFGCGSY